MSDKKFRVAIIGATGYTGSESAALLNYHPHVEIVFITSEQHRGKQFSEIHPQFEGILDSKLVSVNDIQASEIDVALLALPHGVSMDYVAQFKNEKFKIIDFSGDYRLSTPEVYNEWYAKTHTFPEAFSKAVYGLPELFRDELNGAHIVANPGCYPTVSILSVFPLLKHQLINADHLIIDAKSGTTGAGIKPNTVTHFSNVNDNFFAYGLKKHRHTIEIEEILSKKAQKQVRVQFQPHLLPVDRGILATAYAKNKTAVSEEELRKLYVETYAGHPFIRLRKSPPALKDVRGTNFCDIYVTTDERTGNILVVAAIDNLVKGAAGQAVHNLNLMFGLNETAGLEKIAMKP